MADMDLDDKIPLTDRYPGFSRGVKDLNRESERVPRRLSKRSGDPANRGGGVSERTGNRFSSLRCCAALPLQAEHSPRLAAGRVQVLLKGVRWAIIPNVQIAVVEDDPLVRDFVVDTLEFSVNRKVHTFDNGFAAWQYIQTSNPIHIVFSDIHVPDIDGLELTTRIKAAQLEIICILASGNPADALRASEAGAFVLKPYGVSDLVALVQTFVVEDQGRRG